MKIYDYQPVYDILFNRVPTPTYLKIRKDGDYYLATSAARGEIISLNKLAGEICLACNGKNKLEDIYNELLRNYPDTDKLQIAYDLCRCIADLESFGMVSVVRR